jgi:hypothetical protein
MEKGRFVGRERGLTNEEKGGSHTTRYNNPAAMVLSKWSNLKKKSMTRTGQCCVMVVGSIFENSQRFEFGFKF